MSEELKKLYIKSCSEEIYVNKPGNHSFSSRIAGMYSEKFRLASIISAEILIKKNINLGEMIFISTKKCIDTLNSNYNLGILLLCAPLMKAMQNKPQDLRKEIKKTLENLSILESNLVMKAINYAKPAGLKRYDGKANVNSKYIVNKNIVEIMKVSSEWDRISRCYANSYSEIFNSGLPLYRNLKKKVSKNKAIQILYISYAKKYNDSHILRKFGKNKANIVLKMFKNLDFKINKNYFKNFERHILFLDNYLKRSNLNPGTCADLTVTTLLMDKIKDIFKYQL